MDRFDANDFLNRLKDWLSFWLEPIMPFLEVIEDRKEVFDKWQRRFISKGIIGLPRKRNGKRRMITLSEVRERKLFIYVLLYNELLLHILCRSIYFQAFIYTVLFAIGFGFLLNIPAMPFPKIINRIMTVLIWLALDLVYFVEIVYYSAYKCFMTPSAIRTEISGLLSNHQAQLEEAVKGNLVYIAALLLPMLIYLLFGRRYFQMQQYRLYFCLYILLFSLAITGLFSFFASVGKSSLKYRKEYNFSTAVSTFGLAEGLTLNGLQKTRGPVFTYNKGNTSDDTENALSASGDETGSVSDNKSAVKLSRYVNSQTPTGQNDYTGLFKDKNIIMICAESLSGAAISEELTPTLYRLVHNGIYFSDFYQPYWGGTDTVGEYAFLTGLVPSDGNIMKETEENNMYFTIGNQMQRLGYTNAAYYNGQYYAYDRQDAIKNLGYGYWCARGNGMYELTGVSWPTDEEMLQESIKEYVDQQPFSLYYKTMSGNAPYTAEAWNLPEEYLDKVKAYLSTDYTDAELYYLAKQYELEMGLESLIDELEAEGIADDTVIVICPDHYPYGLQKSAAWGTDADSLSLLYGSEQAGSFWVRDKSSLVIWSECLEGSYSDKACEISSPTSSLDVVPTLSNLFGLDYDSRLLAGRDVFSDEEALVLWSNGSWITERGRYDAVTNRFTPAEGYEDAENTRAYIRSINSTVTNKIQLSQTISKTDYYGLLYGEDLLSSDNRSENVYSDETLEMQGGTESDTETAVETVDGTESESSSQ